MNTKGDPERENPNTLKRRIMVEWDQNPKQILQELDRPPQHLRV
jgi:hypothetical protein